MSNARETGSGNFVYLRSKEDGECSRKKYLTPCRRASTIVLAGGIKFGYPCADTAVTLTAIDYNELTSSTFAFEAAAAEAFDKACSAGKPSAA